MKIMIPGGHLTPALAMIDYIQSSNFVHSERIVFVGRIYSQDTLKQKAVEQEEIQKRMKYFPKKGLRFVPFYASRFVNSSFSEKIKSVFLFFKSFFSAVRIVKETKPDVFLSFGGYMAVPLALACWLQKIPIVTHEQTRVSGMANKIIAFFAKKVAISYEETTSDFLAKKVILTGNPVRKQVLNTQAQRPEWMPPRLNTPLLLVMGGNQGSKVINKAIARSLDSLLSEWTVVHQCGKKTNENNSLEILEKKRTNLDDEKQNRYFIREWITEDDLAWMYQNAFGAVSRSGANTVQELAMVCLPAVLIPLPFSYKNEQLISAQWLVKEGGAILLEQAALEISGFDKALAHLQQSHRMMKQNLKRLSLERHADKKLYDLLLEVVNEKK